MFETSHIRGSHNVPRDLLTGDSADPTACTDDRVVLVCRSGARARKACAALREAGFPSAVVLEGGSAAFEQSGCPVVRRASRRSMDRQVRMTAGPSSCWTPWPDSPPILAWAGSPNPSVRV